MKTKIHIINLPEGRGTYYMAMLENYETRPEINSFEESEITNNIYEILSDQDLSFFDKITLIEMLSYRILGCNNEY